MELHPVGTRVVWRGYVGTINKVDDGDEILPYRVEYDDGGVDWIGPAEKANEAVFTIRESDVEDVEINTDHPEGRIQALGWIAFEHETPEDLRERIEFNREEIIACEAMARFKEGRDSATTEQQNSVAFAIYNKPYDGLADFAKNVVGRVIDSYYRKPTDAA